MLDKIQRYEGSFVVLFLAVIGFILFFLMLFVPTTYRELKAILLAILLVSISVGALRYRVLQLHRSVFFLFLFYSWLGFSYVYYGAVNDNPGAIKVSTVHVVWPLVYMLLVSSVSKLWVLRGLLQVLIFASAAISLYALYYYFYIFGVIPATLYFELDMGQSIGIYDGFVEYNLYAIASLIFLFPFVAACLTFWSSESSAPVSMICLVLVFILLSCASILSGRRGLWLVMGLTPILLAFLLLLTKKNGAKPIVDMQLFFYLTIIGLGLLVVFSTVFDVSLISVTDNFLEGFRFASNSSSSARSEQFFALVNGWAENPIFGAGLGAPAEGSVRSVNSPWAYELYFLSILYQTGLVGFLIYATGISWIVFYALKIIRFDPQLRMYMAPVLIGMVSFLIASNTNPYLGKFDYLWVIFLPVAIINNYLLKGGLEQPRE